MLTASSNILQLADTIISWLFIVKVASEEALIMAKMLSIQYLNSYLAYVVIFNGSMLADGLQWKRRIKCNGAITGHLGKIINNNGAKESSHGK